MDVFSLTETEFFRLLTEGNNENLHIAYKDFVLQVSEICSKITHKGYVITALLYAEVEIQHLQTARQRGEVNQELAAFINKALHFVHHTLNHYKEMEIAMIPVDDCFDSINLEWNADKTDFMELCYALKIGKCLNSDATVTDIMKALAKAFNLNVNPNYLHKRFTELKSRSKKSRTAFLDVLQHRFNRFLHGSDTGEWESA